MEKIRETELKTQKLRVEKKVGEERAQESGMRGIFFELLEVAVFNLLHKGLTLEEIALEVGGELARHDEELVVCHFGKRDWATRWNEMRTPLEHEAGVPESEDGEQDNRGDKGSAWGTEASGGTIEENGEAENKKRSERNEKAVAVGRDARPIGVTRNEKIKSQQSSEEWSADARLAPAKENQSGNREKKDRGPDK